MQPTILMLEMIYGGMASWPNGSGTHMSGAAYLGAGGRLIAIHGSR